MESLRRFFIEEFRELYRREKRWMIILPEVVRSMSPGLVERAVEQHLEQTAARVIHLEALFRLMAVADIEDSRAIKPLLKEADQVLTAVALSSRALRQQARKKLPRRGTMNHPAWARVSFFNS